MGLLESGKDLTYIQELLGHGHSKTIEIHAHVSRKNREGTVSPIDTTGLPNGGARRQCF